MYYPYYQPQPQQAQPQNSIIWVQGLEGAKSYLVAPNNSVILMDSEGSKFYIKSADVSGMPILRAYTYTEDAPQGSQSAVNAPNVEIIGRKDIEALEGKIENIHKELEALNSKVLGELTARDKLAKAKKVVSDDE